MRVTTEVLVIGAGPYGLSISTHLRGQAIDHLIVGRPMDTWRAHMPAGMYLKSEPFGSDMSCPQAGYDLEGYCRSERVDGIGRGIPLPLEQVPRLLRLVHQAPGSRLQRCHGDRRSRR